MGNSEYTDLQARIKELEEQVAALAEENYVLHNYVADLSTRVVETIDESGLGQGCDVPATEYVMSEEEAQNWFAWNVALMPRVYNKIKAQVLENELDAPVALRPFECTVLGGRYSLDASNV